MQPSCALCHGRLIPGLNTDFCSQECEQTWDRLDASWRGRISAECSGGVNMEACRCATCRPPAKESAED
jgi:hypothetical protein